MTALSWRDTVRYCGMLKSSSLAQSLAAKAKKKDRNLTIKEIQLIEKFARVVEKEIGTESRTVSMPRSTGLDLPPELLLYADQCKVVVRGKWLIDQYSEAVLGRVDGDLVTLYPNHLVHVADLAREMLRCSG
jgi:hypothetical protein